MVDGADLGKIEDAREAIEEMLTDPSIVGKTVLFLINKSVETI